MAGKDITIDDPGRVSRLAAALIHELRIEVLLAHANGGPASATMLAKEDLGSLGSVAYHQVKLRELGVLERVNTRKKRGAYERIYDLTDFGREVLETAVAFGSERDA